MANYLSKTTLESYRGDVLPLQLLSDSVDLTQAPIQWSCDSDLVKLRTFDTGEPLSFRNGVLLTLLRPGTAVVTAKLCGEDYTCTVTIREAKTASSEDPMEYFFADLHTHAVKTHNFDYFPIRTEGFPRDMIAQLKEEDVLDLGVITDHADLLNPRDFFRGFTETEDAMPMDLVMLPGSESEVSALEYDRYGVSHKNSGEVVMLNADTYANAYSWDEFWKLTENNPYYIGTFAHPQVVGAGIYAGIWNFRFQEHNDPRTRRFMRLIETGRGTPKSENLIHEYCYSLALDNGFRVCPTSSSDCHGPVWGAHVIPGKTVVMAPEKSREAFVDAIRNNRVYATASGNVKLRYQVNGCTAPADLPDATEYKFHVEATCFHDDPTTVPVQCQVISDGGVCVKCVEGDLSNVDFTVESATARYFFLRLVDGEGRKTWSVPVWTGRPFSLVCEENLTPMEKTGWTAVDTVTGADAAALLDNDPNTLFESDAPTATILLDMGSAQSIRALGHYPQILLKSLLEDAGVAAKDYSQWISRFAHGYRIRTSADGKEFTTVAEGVFRSYGGEEIVTFPKHTARYVQLEILSTVGKASCLPQFADAGITLAELTLFA